MKIHVKLNKTKTYTSHSL